MVKFGLYGIDSIGTVDVDNIHINPTGGGPQPTPTSSSSPTPTPLPKPIISLCHPLLSLHPRPVHHPALDRHQRHLLHRLW